jgi:probable rRNA maturation factor
MNPKTSSITVQFTCETTCRDIDITPLRRLARGVLRQHKIYRAAVSVAIVDDTTMKALHLEFLGKTKITDVMSFDLSDPLEKSKCFDIIINVEQARRQAAVRGHSAQAETALYLVHGLLHQLGFDDLQTSQARRMHQQEDKILQDAGFGTIYDSKRKG